MDTSTFETILKHMMMNICHSDHLILDIIFDNQFIVWVIFKKLKSTFAGFGNLALVKLK